MQQTAASPPKLDNTAPAATASTFLNSTASGSASHAAAADVPQERIGEMRRAIHEHLQKSNVFNDIRNIIDTYAADHPDFDPQSTDDVMRIVRERGLVQELIGRMQQSPITTMNAPSSSSSQTRLAVQSMKRGCRYLHVRVLQGRAFLDHLDLDPAFAKTHQMVVAMHFGHQRFRCVPQPCSVDPVFDDDFLILLEDSNQAPSSGVTGLAATALSHHGGDGLLDIATPLHIAVIRESCAFDKAQVLGENTIEWRRVLRTGYLTLSVELCGDSPGVPTGIVELQLEVMPGPPRKTEDEIVARLELQRTAILAADREFLIYARRWWAEFLQMRPSHAERKVKVFAATSNGRMIPVTHFVSVLQPDRVIESPMAAARFVALFALHRDEDLTTQVLSGGGVGGAGGAFRGGGAASDTWLAPLLFYSQRRGDICNHATLLCSLLLGFGLDAYCAVGTTTASTGNGSGTSATHMFVVTRRKTLQSPPNDWDVTLWEPTTGERFAPTSGQHSFVSIGCAFNHRVLYANVQSSDNVVTCRYDFEDEGLWKAVAPLKLRLVPKYPPPPLLWIPLNTRAMELELEAALQSSVYAHRDGLGLPTVWDSDLAFCLTQALVQYEQQRVLNTPAAELGFFQQCIKGKIGEGRTFRGVPLNVTHVSERKILQAFLASAGGTEILTLTADDMRFAIRVKCYAFPEGVVSAWIMLAVSYRVPLN